MLVKATWMEALSSSAGNDERFDDLSVEFVEWAKAFAFGVSHLFQLARFLEDAKALTIALVVIAEDAVAEGGTFTEVSVGEDLLAGVDLFGLIGLIGLIHGENFLLLFFLSSLLCVTYGKFF